MNTDKDYTQFNEIVRNMTNGNWKDAAKILNNSDLDANSLLKINRDANDCFLAYYDLEQEKHDVVNPYPEPERFAILVDMAHDLKLNESHDSVK